MSEAKLRITVDIFSGRKNPRIEFSGKKLEDLAKRLSPKLKYSTKKIVPPPFPTLGYRGIVVEQIGMPVKEMPAAFRIVDGTAIIGDTSYAIADDAFEDFMGGSVKDVLPLETFRREVARFKKGIDFFNSWSWREKKFKPQDILCDYAPIYEPDWWDQEIQQTANNCYNYATNYRTDTFAQPGLAAGNEYTALTGDNVMHAATSDKLIYIPEANNEFPPTGHLVALAIWPGADFHWLRKGQDGTWSHKMGQTPVTNVDNIGNAINDPSVANLGNYSFYTYMRVMNGHIKIA